jgi:hypothetical protein
MIMGENDSSSAVLQGPHGHFARVNRSAIQGSEEQVITANHPILTIQENAAEYFPATTSQVMLQKLACRFRTAQYIPVTSGFEGMPSTQLQRCPQLGIFGLAHTWKSLQARPIGTQHAGQTLKV